MNRMSIEEHQRQVRRALEETDRFLEKRARIKAELRRL